MYWFIININNFTENREPCTVLIAHCRDSTVLKAKAPADDKKWWSIIRVIIASMFRWTGHVVRGAEEKEWVLKKGNSFQYLNMDEMIMLKCVSDTWDGNKCTRIIWLNTGTGERGNKLLHSLKWNAGNLLINWGNTRSSTRIYNITLIIWWLSLLCWNKISWLKITIVRFWVFLCGRNNISHIAHITSM